MRVQELAMVMDFTRKVGIFFIGGFEHDLDAKVALAWSSHHQTRFSTSNLIIANGVRLTFEPLVSLCVAR